MEISAEYPILSILPGFYPLAFVVVRPTALRFLSGWYANRKYGQRDDDPPRADRPLCRYRVPADLKGIAACYVVTVVVVADF